MTHPILRALCIALLLGTTLNAAAAPSARDIMQRVDDRDDGDNGVFDMEMVLIDKNGHERQRTLRSYTKDKGEDRQRIMFFLEPADVKDTAFLTYDYHDYDKDDDQWLYLPALRKSKRIASTDKSGSFMGSDFNYSDMTRRNLNAYDFTLLKEMEVRGAKTWLIQAVPKSPEEVEESGYDKSLLFVRQDNDMVVRAVHWVAHSNKLKYLDVPELAQIDGVWQALEMVMTTKQGKVTTHQTIMRFHNVRFNQGLEADMFTLRRLEKGL